MGRLPARCYGYPRLRSNVGFAAHDQRRTPHHRPSHFRLHDRPASPRLSKNRFTGDEFIHSSPYQGSKARGGSTDCGRGDREAAAQAPGLAGQSNIENDEGRSFGYPETGLEDINRNLPEADFTGLIASCKPDRFRALTIQAMLSMCLSSQLQEEGKHPGIQIPLPDFLILFEMAELRQSKRLNHRKKTILVLRALQ